MDYITLQEFELTGRVFSVGWDSVYPFLRDMREDAIRHWKEDHGQDLEFLGLEIDPDFDEGHLTGRFKFKVKEEIQNETR